MKSDIDKKIQGFVADGFEPVKEAFVRNFEQELELGAAFAVYQHDECVVDLWGGIADRQSGNNWDAQTLQMIFSGSKVLVAIVMILLVDRKELDFEKPVAHYWPEFGKPEILVRHILAHEAGLPGIEIPLSTKDIVDDRRMAALIAAQLPNTDPRAGKCYHAVTFGWMCAEIVYRVCGQSIGEVFHARVAKPLGLDIWLGLPKEHAHRVAKLVMDETMGMPPILDPGVWAHDPLILSIWGNPPLFDPANMFWNDFAWQTCEIPSLNAIVQAKSMARLFSHLISEKNPVISKANTHYFTDQFADWFDETHQVHWPYSAGFQLQDNLGWFGPVEKAFGYVGAGGSIHAAWPDHHIGFSYAMNVLREPAQGRDMRGAALLSALHKVVA